MYVPEIDHYDRSKYQNSITKEYFTNIMTYIKSMYPEVDEAYAEQKVKQIVKERLTRPKVAIINHKSYGNAELIKPDLLDVTNDMSDRIVTPSGSTYMPPTKKVAFVKQMMQDDLAQRKIVKNQMLDHEARGEERQAKIKNYVQSRIKISVNSISGAMGSAYNCLYDPAGYNAITATCRHGCMVGYGHAERFLEGNFYFQTIEDCINWIVQLLRICPTKESIDTILTKYKLFTPSAFDVLDHFVECLKLYSYNVDKLFLQQYLCKLNQHEITFIYYACNLMHLMRKNGAYFKPWLDRFFANPSFDNIESIDPKDLFKIDDDLLTMVTAINPALLEGMLIYETLDKRPDITRKVIAICQKMQSQLDEIQDIFDLFFNIMVDLPHATQHKNMIRKTVIVSDTDSVIFTTKNWVEWYSGLNYNPESFQINAFIIYLLTKSLIHTFAVMSMNIGMKGDDLRKIAMKNEYLYPVLMRTPMGKHYVGVITIQEGRVLAKKKKDIKGKNFRGSDLCPETLAFVENFLFGMIDDFMDNYTLSGHKLIEQVLTFEHRIRKSLVDKETTFLGTMPLKPAEEYANPDASNYFYYLLWSEVFAEKYDVIHIPQKCKVVPIKTAKLKSTKFLEQLKAKDKKLHDRLVDFMERYPNKKITRIFMPPHIPMPEEIVPIIDIRHVIYSNCTPLYLAFRSLGIGIIAKGKQSIFSDMYNLEGADNTPLPH